MDFRKYVEWFLNDVSLTCSRQRVHENKRLAFTKPPFSKFRGSRTQSKIDLETVSEISSQFWLICDGCWIDVLSKNEVIADAMLDQRRASCSSVSQVLCWEVSGVFFRCLFSLQVFQRLLKDKGPLNGGPNQSKINKHAFQNAHLILTHIFKEQNSTFKGRTP